MVYDAIITGGGIAGLTAAAYLCKAGRSVVLCEKEEKLGGLVNSFDYKGFSFDGGIRAIENSGIVLPMLRQLGIDIDFIKNNVSIGIEKQVVNLVSDESLYDYQALLNSQFPQSSDDIEKIILDIKRVMGYMDVLYGIDNPLFLDLKKDKQYLYKTIMPWLFKYIFTIRKIQKLDTPIDEYLNKLTANKTLIDMIAQHFFKKTPAFFALSYFSLYLDYQYPRGGIGSIIDKLEKYIIDRGGEIRRKTQIKSVDPQKRQAADTNGNIISYRKLIWAADLKTLYKIADADALASKKTRQNILKQKNRISDKTGGDSVFTLYLTAGIDKSYFENICGAHFFYTPLKKGLINIDLDSLKTGQGHQGTFTADKQTIIVWLDQFYELTTYEISFPVMRDDRLAPPGKTGLIISTLFEYSLVKHIFDMGWYEEFKEASAQKIISVLSSSIFPDLKTKVEESFSSTPLTLEKITGNSEGAITGWAFTKNNVPVVKNLPKVAHSVRTPFPDILQAGQWTFSPSGLPISILTGKLAADSAEKKLKR